MKPPTYQRLLVLFMWTLGFVVIAGAILDALSNAAALITTDVATVATCLIVVVSVAVHLRLRRHPLPWLEKGGTLVGVRGLGPKYWTGVVGTIGLVWAGAVLHPPQTAGTSIRQFRLSLGGSSLVPDTTNDVFFSTPTEVSSASFATTYLPIYIRNPSDLTVDEVLVSLRYPHKPRLAIIDSVRQSSIGELASQEFQRRSETFEGHDFTFLSVARLGPRKTIFLSEPIETAKELCREPAGATIEATASARDLVPQRMDIRIRCLVADVPSQADEMIRAKLWQEAAAHRRETSFLAYARQAISHSRLEVTIVVPQFRGAMDASGNRGFMSDPMHDKLSTATYDPLPWSYLTAPLLRTSRD